MPGVKPVLVVMFVFVSVYAFAIFRFSSRVPGLRR